MDKLGPDDVTVAKLMVAAILLANSMPRHIDLDTAIKNSVNAAEALISEVMRRA